MSPAKGVMSPGSPRARGLRRSGWLGLIAVVSSLAFGAWLLARGWLWREIRAHAARHGVALSACDLELRRGGIGLEACSFRLLPEAAERGWPIARVQASGTIEAIHIGFAGLRPDRIHARGIQAVLRGEPRWQDMLGPSGGPALPSLPIDVESSGLTWYFDAGHAPALVLSGLGYAADTRRLTSKLEIFGRAEGQLSLSPAQAQVTLGDPARPGLRLDVHLTPSAQRAELSLELRKFPLRQLEGDWLRLTAVLRAIELDGRVSLTIPTGLTMALPTGDMRLTLHGLQFPVPREVEGLVHGSPPQLSGKLSGSRLLERFTFPDVSFLTGSLEMHGPAEVEVDEGGLHIRANLSGPLPCRAIAEAAANAHAESALATLLGRIAERTLTGSVQVVAAIEAHTAELERAEVLTSIGVGCGLAPLPIDPSVPRELLERLPRQILDQLPKRPDYPFPGNSPGNRLRSPPRLERRDGASSKTG